MWIKGIPLIMFALFITGLADGLSWAFLAIPGVGIPLAFAVGTSINITMGAGLMGMLMAMGMYYPKYMFTIPVGGALPGVNVFPFWTALVIMSLVEKSKEEGGAIGSVASSVASLTMKNPISAIQGAQAVRTVSERQATGRPPALQPAAEAEESRPLTQNRPQLQDIVRKPYAKAA